MTKIIKETSVLQKSHLRGKRRLSLFSLPAGDNTTMRTDTDKKMKVLLESLDVLQALAKMDSETWQQTLYDSQPTDAKYSDKNSAAAIQKHFDRLQSQWKLEETPIPQLFESIHQFHSNCTHLSAHSDYLSEENKFLREQLMTAQSRSRKLETTVKKLHEKKGTLEKEIDSMNSERENLMKGVGNYASDFYDSQTSLNIRQLESHERIMKLVVDTGENKGRTSPTSETAASCCSSSEDRSLSSTNSVPCITNNGLATVRIEQIEMEPTETIELTDMSKKYGWFKHIVSSEEYHTLHYPANSKVGIQFHPMQRVYSDTGIKKQRRFSPLQKYTNKPRELVAGSDRTKEEHGGFFVCGHYGFDYSLNAAPSIGSRLVAVNGKELNTNEASLLEIREAIREGSPFSLSFKLGPLEIKEEQILAKAVKAAKLEYAKQ